MSQANVESTASEQGKAVDGPRPAFPTVAQVCENHDEFLGKLDIAALNLICVSGLPGGEIYSVSDLLAWIDRAALTVRSAIDNNCQKFLDDPAAFDHSYAKFSILYLITVLQRECGGDCPFPS